MIVKNFKSSCPFAGFKSNEKKLQ